MSTRARTEKGRFVTGSAEFDIVPQKWRQEWVHRQIISKDGKTETDTGFKTRCWVPVKDTEPLETSNKLPEQTSEQVFGEDVLDSPVQLAQDNK